MMLVSLGSSARPRRIISTCAMKHACCVWPCRQKRDQAMNSLWRRTFGYCCWTEWVLNSSLRESNCFLTNTYAQRLHFCSTGTDTLGEGVTASACGYSYSTFVRKCAEVLTERQLQRVALRLLSYKNLKKKPRPHNRAAVLRDVSKIIPESHRKCLLNALTQSLDIVDPEHFLRLAKVTQSRGHQHEDDVDSLPQSLLGDYTFGSQMLRTTHQCGNGIWISDSSSGIPSDASGYPKEVASRPPSATRLSEKRVGELVVEWSHPSISAEGSISERLVFMSNIPHAARSTTEAAVVSAFSGCGTITNLEIFDDRLRTLDQNDANSMQAKGEQAINDKLAGRFSPIFALAEFQTVEQKLKACTTYLRTFGVPCIDRLIYPEDAALKKTLVATNLPFVLTPDEIARIIAFVLVEDNSTYGATKSICRIHMVNPHVYNYDNVAVEARSDCVEPYFTLPLHESENGNFPNRGRMDAKTGVADHIAKIFGSTETSVPNVTGLVDRTAIESHQRVTGDLDLDVFFPRVSVDKKHGARHGMLSEIFHNLNRNEDMARHVIKKYLMNRLVINNDGLFVLRFKSFEAAIAAVRKNRRTVIFDTKALLLFSPRRCVSQNGILVDFPTENPGKRGFDH